MGYLGIFSIRYPKPYSIKLRGTIGVSFWPRGLGLSISPDMLESGNSRPSSASADKGLKIL